MEAGIRFGEASNYGKSLNVKTLGEWIDLQVHEINVCRYNEPNTHDLCVQKGLSYAPHDDECGSPTQITGVGLREWGRACTHVFSVVKPAHAHKYHECWSTCTPGCGRTCTHEQGTLSYLQT